MIHRWDKIIFRESCTGDRLLFVLNFRKNIDKCVTLSTFSGLFNRIAIINIPIIYVFLKNNKLYLCDFMQQSNFWEFVQLPILFVAQFLQMLSNPRSKLYVDLQGRTFRRASVIKQIFDLHLSSTSMNYCNSLFITHFIVFVLFQRIVWWKIVISWTSYLKTKIYL